MVQEKEYGCIKSTTWVPPLLSLNQPLLSFTGEFSGQHQDPDGLQVVSPGDAQHRGAMKGPRRLSVSLGGPAVVRQVTTGQHPS